MSCAWTSRSVLILSLTFSVSSIAQAQQANTRQDDQKSIADKGKESKQRASGVILKVEKIAARDGKPAGHRLTINTNAVWRDWSRDQAKLNDIGSAQKDAAEGKNSVTTRGEPADKNSMVVVDVFADAKVETRFRSPQDETDKGSKTPEAVSGEGKRSSSAKPVQFKAEDLKPGLFIEVDFRHDVTRNAASTVAVIRPIEKRDTGRTERSK